MVDQQPGDFDAVVIGAGPAGIAAAVRAAETGARVAIVDEGLTPGGQIWRGAASTAHPSRAARRWLRRLEGSDAIVISPASVVDVDRAGKGFQLLGEREGVPVVLRAGALVIATGARELFLPFPGWTLPNVVGVGGAQALLKAGVSFSGRRVVIAGTGPLIFPVAASLARAGAKALVVADQAPAGRIAAFGASLWRTPAALAQAVALRAAFATTRYSPGTWLLRADGKERLETVTITDGRRSRRLEVDFACVSFGLVPNTELARLLGCELHDGFVSTDARQATTIPGVFAAGELTGIGGAELSIVEGEIAGAAACGGAAAPALFRRRETLREYAERLRVAFALRPEVLGLARDDTIVCRCEDVPLGAIDPRWSSREAKLYTRAGMGACQGRICSAALQAMRGSSYAVVRPPILPARLATLARLQESRLEGQA